MHFSALGAFQLWYWLCMHYPSRGNAYAEVGSAARTGECIV